MNKKKKKIIIGICIAVAVLSGMIIKIGEYYNYHFKRSLQKDDFNRIHYIEFNHENGNICLVTNGYNNVGEEIFDKYIGVIEYDYIAKLIGGGEIYEVRKINKADVNIYNLETRELVKTINLKKILKKDLSDYKFGKSIQMLGNGEGNIYIRIRIKDSISSSKEYANGKFAYLDLETEEIVMILSMEESEMYEEEIRERNENAPIAYSLIEEDEIGIMEANNLEIPQFTVTSGGVDYSYLSIILPKESIPTEDIRLYQEFPGLRNYEMREGEWLSVNLNKPCGPKELIELFLEEGQEISFEGCVLPAESSVDGKEHEINSFEDYYQWKKWDNY